MRKRILVALAILVLGAAMLPGCLFYAGPWWHDWDHDGHWEGEHQERHGGRMQEHGR